ncbi:MAG: hypothetical protein H3C31_01990 [Brumimicrobium sp.]|nr:hypothetical protein [Brumimicrobium sp.]
MKINWYSFRIGLVSFMIVLLLMPIGHALMVLNEIILQDHKFLGAFGIGFIGLILLVFGLVNNHHRNTATVLGFLAGVLVWTGWVEFSFVWIAEKLKVAPLMDGDGILTKPEYLVMLSSIGLLLSFLLLFLFSKTKCTFFVWIQKIFKIKQHIDDNKASFKPLAIITFIETIMLLWTFYIVLLVVYDNDIAGDRHPATFIVALGSLIWSLYLIFKLLRISKLDYAIRYAIPTVIIFWNVVEIMGRWNLFQEIWVLPIEYILENVAILLGLIGVSLYYFYFKKKKKIQPK